MRKIVLTLFLLSFLSLLLSGCGGGQAKGDTIRVYTRSDACGAAETWAKYLGNHFQEDLKGTAVYGDPGLAEAVRQDPLGIGYNNIGYAYDISTGEVVAGLKVVPIDINENGQIDPEENFYNTKAELTQAIANGHYPSPPARELYLVTKDSFKGLAKEFVRWVLTDGQRYVDEAGYVMLAREKIEAELNKLGQRDTGIKMEGKIYISGAWALYPMVVKWAEEFRKFYPGVDFDISAGGAGKGMVDALAGMVDIGMVSRAIYPTEVEQGAFGVAVTKDAVVPVINEKNPLLPEILTKGVRKQTFIDIWITQQVTDWRDVAK